MRARVLTCRGVRYPGVSTTAVVLLYRSYEENLVCHPQQFSARQEVSQSADPSGKPDGDQAAPDEKKPTAVEIPLLCRLSSAGCPI